MTIGLMSSIVKSAPALPACGTGRACFSSRGLIDSFLYVSYYTQAVPRFHGIRPVGIFAISRAAYVSELVARIHRSNIDGFAVGERKDRALRLAPNNAVDRIGIRPTWESGDLFDHPLGERVACPASVGAAPIRSRRFTRQESYRTTPRLSRRVCHRDCRISDNTHSSRSETL